MKKLFLLLLVLPFLASCSSDDDIKEPFVLTSLNIEAVDKDLYIGDEYQLKIISEPQTIKTSECTWKSSNNDVASVSQSGLVSVKAKGDATISVSYGDVSNSIILKVYDTLFGYKFGSTIEEVNPQVKVSNEFAYNWASVDLNPPMRAFKFSNNKLTSVWSCHEAVSTSKSIELFTKEVHDIGMNPEFNFSEIIHDDFTVPIKNISPDSLKWSYNGYNYLLRNGTMQIENKDFPMLIIEYSQAN